MSKVSPKRRIAAYAVHTLTASGILCGYIALLYATKANWTAAFAWLGIALFLDGIDGPLARRAGVELHLPRFSGKQLDLIVDYFNYVVIPALMISLSTLLPEALRLVASAAILLTALYHFADQNSKSEDGFFIGFPALWNVVVFYLFVFRPAPEIAALVILVFALLTFVPLHWLHPVRAKRPRTLNILVAVLWFCAAAATLWSGFAPDWLVETALLLSAAYFLGISLARSARPALFKA